MTIRCYGNAWMCVFWSFSLTPALAHWHLLHFWKGPSCTEISTGMSFPCMTFSSPEEWKAGQLQSDPNVLRLHPFRQPDTKYSTVTQQKQNPYQLSLLIKIIYVGSSHKWTLFQTSEPIKKKTKKKQILDCNVFLSNQACAFWVSS